MDIVLRAGANISTADIHGGYPLHYAAQMCGPGGEMGRNPKIGLRILNVLLSNDIDIDVKDKDGRQPILWAASAGTIGSGLLNLSPRESFRCLLAIPDENFLRDELTNSRKADRSHSELAKFNRNQVSGGTRSTKW